MACLAGKVARQDAGPGFCAGMRINEGALWKGEIIEILSEISIDMQSYLLRWRLQDPEDTQRLPLEEIRQQAEENYALLSAWG